MFSDYTAKPIAVAATVFTCLGSAHAGSCPADKRLAEPREIEDAQGSGVERPLLGIAELNEWRDIGSLGDFTLRLRKLIIAPDGTVPTHDHEDRPSIVHIVSGKIIEHNAYCAEPIIHVAGETAVEAGPGHTHWWENPYDEPVVLFSTDVVPRPASRYADKVQGKL